MKLWKKLLLISPTVVLLGVCAVLFYPFYSDRKAPIVNISMTGTAFSMTAMGDLTITDDGAGLREVNIKLIDSQGGVHVPFTGKGRKKQMSYDMKLNLALMPEGKCRLIVEARDISLWRNKTIKETEFLIDRTPPKTEMTIAPKSVDQGGVLSVYVDVDDKVFPDYSVVDVNIFGRSSLTFAYIGVQDGRHRYQAIAPILPKAPAGESTVGISFSDMVGNRSFNSAKFEVRDVAVKMELLDLPEPKARLLADDVRRKEADRVLAELQEKSIADRKLWNGRFIVPTNGKMEKGFGNFIIYNGGISRERRMGIDIFAPEGTPVKAANSGEVLFAGWLDIYGNTLVIGHGLNVTSHYYHLSDILVSEKEEVRKGQTIGRVGSTGYAGTSKLRWRIDVQGVPVNPDSFLENEF